MQCAVTMDKLKFAMLIYYDGNRYHGWQRQHSDLKQSQNNCVQGALEAAIYLATNEKTSVFASGRTDKGVHAVAQVAQILLSGAVSCDSLRTSINSALDALGHGSSIAVRSVQAVPSSFNPQYSSDGKQYSFWIVQGETLSLLVLRCHA